MNNPSENMTIALSSSRDTGVLRGDAVVAAGAAPPQTPSAPELAQLCRWCGAHDSGCWPMNHRTTKTSRRSSRSRVHPLPLISDGRGFHLHDIGNCGGELLWV
jgi:hypothetical protein